MLARATRAESRCRWCCRAEAPAAAAADAPKLPLLLPLTPAPVVGAAIVAVAVLHVLLELCWIPRFNTLGPHPLTVTLGRSFYITISRLSGLFITCNKPGIKPY